MERFPRVPELGAGPDLAADIDRWLASPALSALVQGFGGTADLLQGDVANRLEQLDRFSQRWDTRKGVERNVAPSLDLSREQEATVLSAAEALGLMDSRPPRRTEYDHVLILGGLLRACVTRPAYAARLLASGAVRAENLTALGGHRPFGGDEHELARLAGIPHVSEEFDALDAGTRAAFDLAEPVEVDGVTSDMPGGAWCVKTYRGAGGLVVRVAAAPSTEPRVRRANTADTYEWFARRLAKLDRGQRVLAVTTSIYVPAQQAAALRMLALPYGVEVETVGLQPGEVVAALEQTFTPTHYLQEVRSTIHALRDLYRACRAVPA